MVFLYESFGNQVGVAVVSPTNWYPLRYLPPHILLSHLHSRTNNRSFVLLADWWRRKGTELGAVSHNQILWGCLDFGWSGGLFCLLFAACSVFQHCLSGYVER